MRPIETKGIHTFVVSNVFWIMILELKRRSRMRARIFLLILLVVMLPFSVQAGEPGLSSPIWDWEDYMGGERSPTNSSVGTKHEEYKVVFLLHIVSESDFNILNEQTGTIKNAMAFTYIGNELEPIDMIHVIIVKKPDGSIYFTTLGHEVAHVIDYILKMYGHPMRFGHR